jgi:hypothetical protein
MKRLLRIIVITLAITALLSATLIAQESDEQKKDKKSRFVDDSRKMELTTSVVLQGNGLNYIFIPGGKEAVSNTDNSRLSLWLRFSMYFNRYKTIGLEGVFGYTRASGRFQPSADYSDPDNPVYYPIETVNHKVLHYGGNVIYNFGYLDVVPFLTFGGGINRITPEEGSSYPLDGSYYDLSVGFGVKYFLKEWFGVRGEGSYDYYFLAGDEIDDNAGALRFHIGAVVTF